MIYFYCLKWGTKYSHEYVNRLYGSLIKHCKQKFKLTCITDDNTNLNENICTVEYNTFDPFIYPKDRLFTREKAVIMHRYTDEYNFILDLDILIHNDISCLIETLNDKPKFIWTEWTPKDQLEGFGFGLRCFINSSLVGWKGENAKFIYEHIDNNKEKVFYTYDSFDRYVFYQLWRKNKIDLWDVNWFYNYNSSIPKYKFNKNSLCCIFNTSHTKYSNRIETELHEATGWAKELWTSYGRL